MKRYLVNRMFLLILLLFIIKWGIAAEPTYRDTERYYFNDFDPALITFPSTVLYGGNLELMLTLQARYPIISQVHCFSARLEVLKRTRSGVELALSRIKHLRSCENSNAYHLKKWITNIRQDPFEIRFRQLNGKMIIKPLRMLDKKETERVRKEQYIEKAYSGLRTQKEVAQNQMVIRLSSQSTILTAQAIAKALDAIIVGYTPVTNDYILDRFNAETKRISPNYGILVSDPQVVKFGPNIYYDHDIWL